MIRISDTNGLVHWTAFDLRIRRMMQNYFAAELEATMKSMNRAWTFHETEGPIFTSRISDSYSADDVFESKGHILRPETTGSSYEYAEHLLNTHSGIQLPFAVWQVGKSFRDEQDKTEKHMRLKEFTQMEFQCLYSASTKNDYSKKVIWDVRTMIEHMILFPCYETESDRLPTYSEKTTDIVCDNNNMELCSISNRTDFPLPNIKVLEIAIGLDRCVYCRNSFD